MPPPPIKLTPIQIDTTNVARFTALRAEAINRSGETVRWGSQVLIIERTPPGDRNYSAADGWRCRQAA
jgi:hypothetical protein